MDPLDSADFREGYGEGLTAGVAMFRKALTALEQHPPTYGLTASAAFALRVFVETAERNVEEWRARPTNI